MKQLLPQGPYYKANLHTHSTVSDGSLTPWLRKSEGDPNAFFRLIVTAADGSYAVTRAYFLDEL